MPKRPRPTGPTPAEVERYQETILTAYNGYSLRDVYTFHCEKIGLKLNSGVLNSLPTAPGDFGAVIELDFSDCNLGEAGAYPVLEVARAAWGLEVLRLRDCGLTNESISLACQVADAHPRLRTLDLRDNPFVSTPSAVMLTKLARQRMLTQSVLLSGTSVAKETVRTLDWQLKDNSRGFPQQGAAFEAALDALPLAERHWLVTPVLTRRLEEEMRGPYKHVITVRKDGHGLPVLHRKEIDKMDEAFQKRDRASGLLSFSGACEAMSEVTGLKVTQADADVEFLFNRCDEDDDGFVDREQWQVMVRNQLALLAEEAKLILLAQLDKAYSETAGGGGVLAVAELPSVITAFCGIIGKPLDRALESRVRSLVLLSAQQEQHGGGGGDEEQLPLRKELFLSASVAALCLSDPALRHPVIERKRLIY